MGCFFFFSSRRRHTRLTCDWSSDVCSSDLGPTAGASTPANSPAPQYRSSATSPGRGSSAVVTASVRASAAPGWTCQKPPALLAEHGGLEGPLGGQGRVLPVAAPAAARASVRARRLDPVG